MKKEYFERLKAVCEKEGFELLKSLPDKDTNFHILAVSKRDIWEGVEFAICQEVDSTIRKIIKTDDKYGGPTLHFSNGDYFIRSYCKPSTEQAYIEQLKKEFEDRGIRKFKIRNTDISMMDGGCLKDPLPEFIYRKDTDTLYFHGVPVYQQGKWATQAKERVEVEPISGQFNHIANTVQFKFKTINMNGLKGNITEFLASQLEAYLNGEVE